MSDLADSAASSCNVSRRSSVWQATEEVDFFTKGFMGLQSGDVSMVNRVRDWPASNNDEGDEDCDDDSEVSPAAKNVYKR